MFDGLERDFISLLCKLADFFCSNTRAMQIGSRRMTFEPRHHRRTCGERFPAAAEAARTLRARRIDHVMSNLGMGAVDAAIELAIENDSAANAGADGHIDQSGPISSGAPTGFRQRGSVAVVLQGDAQFEPPGQIPHWPLAAPAGKKVHIAKLAAQRIYRSSGSNANAAEPDSGPLRSLAQHVRDQFDPVGAAVRIGPRFPPGKHLHAVIDSADRDFCSPDIDRTDHEYSGVIAFASSSVIRRLFLYDKFDMCTAIADR